MMKATTFGQLFPEEEMTAIRSRFSYVDTDCTGTKRLFFDNAGGSLRLLQAEQAFHDADLSPDCSEHSNGIAQKLHDIDAQGRADIRTVFNARQGSIVMGFTASQLMMEAVRVVSTLAKGTNVVTTALEHPSAYDAVKIAAQTRGWEFRVAHADKRTGGVSTESILSLVDADTALLSVMAASNISGHIMDIATIAKKARQINPNIIIICDAVQHAPHGALDPEAMGIDVMNFAPYKFFSIRGWGLMYLSDRVNQANHDQVLCLPADNWDLGSPSTAQFAAFTALLDYVCFLGRKTAPAGASRRKLYECGMKRIADHERALLELMLEGTDKAPGLRHISGVRVLMDDPDLNQRDLITGIEFDHLDPHTACVELEKRGIIAFERVASSAFSERMVHEFDSEGVVRLSPLHVNTPGEIEYFLKQVQEVARL